MGKTAKLFMNGRSQAVRLPREFRFTGKEVRIRRDEKTGDVILSTAGTAADPAAGWAEFIRPRDEALAAGEIPDDFLCAEERYRDPLPPGPFEGSEE